MAQELKEARTTGKVEGKQNQDESHLNGGTTQESSEGEFSSGKQLLATGKVKVTQRSHGDYPPYNVGRIIKTIATYIVFFGGGIGYSIYGATILHLEKQTGSSTKHMAYIFTYRALGSITGNVIVGLLFNKVPPEALLCLASLMFSATNLAVPFCRSLGVLIAMIMLNGFSMGIMGGGCNSYMLKTWRLKTRPFTQALHFIISLGASISPLIVDSFVTDKLTSQSTTNLTSDNTVLETVTSLNSDSSINTSYSKDSSTNFNLYMNTSNEKMDVGKMQLFYPFFIAAIITVLATCLFAGILAVDMRRHLSKVAAGEKGSVKTFIKQQEENVGPMKHKPILVTMVLITMIYGGMEYTYGSWLLAFSVKHLHVSFPSAALISTAYWGSFASGRALSVLTAKFVSPAVTLIVCLMVSTIALVFHTFLCTTHIAVSWVCAIVVGVTFAPIFGNCLTFSQTEVNMPSRVTTVFVFTLYLGFVGMPALVGFLFTAYSPIAFLYVVTAGGVSTTSLFLAVLLYRRFCIIQRNI